MRIEDLISRLGGEISAVTIKEFAVLWTWPKIKREAVDCFVTIDKWLENFGRPLRLVIERLGEIYDKLVPQDEIYLYQYADKGTGKLKLKRLKEERNKVMKRMLSQIIYQLEEIRIYLQSKKDQRWITFYQRENIGKLAENFKRVSSSLSSLDVLPFPDFVAILLFELTTISNLLWKLGRGEFIKEKTLIGDYLLTYTADHQGDFDRTRFVVLLEEGVDYRKLLKTRHRIRYKRRYKGRYKGTYILKIEAYIQNKHLGNAHLLIS